MKFFRIIIFVVALLLLAWGFWVERHEVAGQMFEPTSELSGRDLIQAATTDRLFRASDGTLTDANKLTPDDLTEGDCFT